MKAFRLLTLGLLGAALVLPATPVHAKDTDKKSSTKSSNKSSQSTSSSHGSKSSSSQTSTSSQSRTSTKSTNSTRSTTQSRQTTAKPAPAPAPNNVAAVAARSQSAPAIEAYAPPVVTATATSQKPVAKTLSSLGQRLGIVRPAAYEYASPLFDPYTTRMLYLLAGALALFGVGLAVPVPGALRRRIPAAQPQQRRLLN